MTEISLVSIEDNPSGHSSIERPSRTNPSMVYSNTKPSRYPPNSYGYDTRPPITHQQYERRSYVDDTPGGSPPGTPITGGGGAMPYGYLVPPRYPSYANSTGADTRDSSPFPQSQTPFVSASRPPSGCTRPNSLNSEAKIPFDLFSPIHLRLSSTKSG